MPVNNKEIGKSGIEIFSGQFQEDYLQDLYGSYGADIYDKMRRSDGQVSQALDAVINTIASANWYVEPVDESKQEKEIADFAEFIIKEDLDKCWEDKLREILTFIPFGYSLFEKVHKVVIKHKKWGDYIGFKKLGWRSPRTIESWNIKDGSLDNVEQQAQGDLESFTTIPAKFLTHFSINAEGDNFEGVSMLRPCYGAWLRKNTFLKLMSIGIEKSAIATPKAKFPQGLHGTAEYNNFINMVAALSSHEKNYIGVPVSPDGTAVWDIEFIDTPFDATKVKTAIDYEDSLIMRRFLANFLLLGSQGSGSYALSNDQSDFFLNSLIYLANVAARGAQSWINELITYKYGERDFYPKIKHAGIKDKAGKELADILSILARDGLLKPDDGLRAHVRKSYELPEEVEEEEPKVKTPKAPPQPAPEEKDLPEEDVEEEVKEENIDSKENQKKAVKDKEEEEKVLKKSDRGKSDSVEPFGAENTSTISLAAAKPSIVSLAKRYEALAQEQLTEMANKYNDKIIKNYRAGMGIKSINNLSIQGITKYKKELKSLFMEASNEVRTQVVKELKLSEVKFAQSKGKKRTEEFVAMFVGIIGDTQAKDIEKKSKLAFATTEGITEDAEVIRHDLDKAVKKSIKTSTLAAGTISSQIVNKARLDTFFDDEMKEAVESFTFVNPSPVSAICQYLANKTFEVSDRRALEFHPPLHHNCKTSLRANLRASKKKVPIDEIAPNETQKKSITLK